MFGRCGGGRRCGIDSGTGDRQVGGVHGFDWVGVGLAAALKWNRVIFFFRREMGLVRGLRG